MRTSEQLLSEDMPRLIHDVFISKGLFSTITNRNSKPDYEYIKETAKQIKDLVDVYVEEISSALITTDKKMRVIEKEYTDI